MRVSLCLLAALMATCAPGAVPECKNGSLQSYVELGTDGCAIGGVVVFDFVEFSIPTGADFIPVESIMVKPSRADSRPQLEFNVNVKAGAGEFRATTFAFAATGLGDGVNVNDTTFRTSFPYLGNARAGPTAGTSTRARQAAGREAGSPRA